MRNMHLLYCRTLSLSLLLGGSLLLSGCEMAKPSVGKRDASASSPAKQQPGVQQSETIEAPEPSAEPEHGSAKMMLCQKEMEALKQISTRQYNLYQNEFSKLMRSTAKYAVVRTQVNGNTQEAVDALYSYKAKRLCANISQALMNGLSEMAESAK